jgi:hypothetical protein
VGVVVGVGEAVGTATGLEVGVVLGAVVGAAVGAAEPGETAIGLDVGALEGAEDVTGAAGFAGVDTAGVEFAPPPLQAASEAQIPSTSAIVRLLLRSFCMARAAYGSPREPARRSRPRVHRSNSPAGSCLPNQDISHLDRLM